MRVARVLHADLDPADLTRVGVIPTTTVARALVDAAALVDRQRLEQLVDTALARRLCTGGAVVESMSRASRKPGRKGLPALRDALTVWTEGPQPGSPAEMRLIRKLAGWGFPEPERQYEVTGPGWRYFVDLAWPAERVGGEYDGEEAHTPRRLAADEEREARLVAAGWFILRADRFDVRPSSTRLLDVLSPRLPRLLR
jgi:very-short-patch-repair endonuclease